MNPSDVRWHLSGQNEGLIRITFRIAPSKDGLTSSEARTSLGQSPPRHHPILPAAIPPRRYPGFPPEVRPSLRS